MHITGEVGAKAVCVTNGSGGTLWIPK